MQTITIILKGTPISKQSVRTSVRKDKKGNLIYKINKKGKKDVIRHNYQPEKLQEAKNSYIFQIQEQLKNNYKDFKMFTEFVFIESIDFVYPYPANYSQVKKDICYLCEKMYTKIRDYKHASLYAATSFSSLKKKYTMQDIIKIFFKNTRPDLSDNLKKLPFDAMSGIVYSDDGIIIGESNTIKYYGKEAKTVITLTGE